jgi:yecA family protein
MESKMLHSHDFNELLKNISAYPNAMPRSALHGFLTGVAVGPDEVMDQPWIHKALGITYKDTPADIPQNVSQLMLDVIDFMLDDFYEESFEPLVDSENKEGRVLPRTDLWSQGFVESVRLAEQAWEARTTSDLDLGKNLLGLNMIAETDKFAPIFFDSSVKPQDPDFLLELRETAGPLIQSIAEHVLYDYGEEDFDIESPGEFDFDDGSELMMEDFDPDELRNFSNQELMDLITSMDDLLPRKVVDECVRRGEQITPLLVNFLQDDHNWEKDVHEGRWWALLHCMFILGLIPGPEAAAGLLNVFTRMQNDPDNDLWDWVSGYWPALFRNKRDDANAMLCEIVADANRDWYPRTEAAECVLEAAAAADENALDSTLDWIAQLATDSRTDLFCRSTLGSLLLDYPRARHKALLENLASEQTKSGDLFFNFSYMDIEHAYNETEETPVSRWETFSNPWQFYDPDNIAERLQRWEQDELDDDDFPFTDEGSLGFYSDDFYPETPFIRDSPKVGRNDPCPCGSGKKYKKCCLH